jgi:glycosyltransferase involved in cell wall biosynthesis
MTMTLNVCIVGLKCHDHLSGAEVPRYLGGIETQLATLAKGLVKEGCNVSVITYDHGQSDDECFEGVTVYKSHRPDAGLPFLRTFHPRTSGLLNAMRRANADIYLQMGAGIECGQTAFICKLLVRRFVFCLASDANFGSHLHSGKLGVAGKSYRLGIRRADQIIAQTETQRRGLLKATGHDSIIIPMAVVQPPHTSLAMNKGTMPHVLWVGRITPAKRLNWLLEIARRCPDAIFDIVGTPNKTSAHSTALLREAASVPNVIVHGRASSSALADLYSKASLLCSTSELEGFPTTFLEAWSWRLPVVSAFDPDDVISSNGLGRISTTLDGLTEEINLLLKDESSRASLARAAEDYFIQNHTVISVSRRFKEMLEKTLTAKSGSEPRGALAKMNAKRSPTL